MTHFDGISKYDPDAIGNVIFNTRKEQIPEPVKQYSTCICSTTFTSGNVNGKQVIYGQSDGSDGIVTFGGYQYKNEEEFNERVSFLFAHCW